MFSFLPVVSRNSCLHLRLLLHCSCFRVSEMNQAKISAFFQRGSAAGSSRASGSAGNCQTKSPLKARSLDRNDSICTSINESLKRPRDENDNENKAQTEDKLLVKKQHVDDEDNNATISPEQKQRMQESRVNAKMLLVQKQSSGLITNMGPSWFAALEAEFSKPYFLKLAKFVEEERKKYTVYPPAEQVFSWTRMTPIRQTKVVIIGQDPYHGPNQAHGLCFSVQKGVAPPPSLLNMYQELSTDIEGFIRPNHGCLTGWAEQGVLLLNAVLTVRAHDANSHKDKGWEMFTDAVISWLDKNTDGTVFMLWGSYAQKKGAKINKKKHHVLQGVHPSPLSAHRGFFGSRHFSRCNELLVKQGKKPIDWSRFV